MDSQEYQKDMRKLMDDIPVGIAQMSERQMLSCILYQLYEMNKRMKHLDDKVIQLQKRARPEKEKIGYPYART